MIPPGEKVDHQMVDINILYIFFKGMFLIDNKGDINISKHAMGNKDNK